MRTNLLNTKSSFRVLGRKVLVLWHWSFQINNLISVTEDQMKSARNKRLCHGNQYSDVEITGCLVWQLNNVTLKLARQSAIHKRGANFPRR